MKSLRLTSNGVLLVRSKTMSKEMVGRKQLKLECSRWYTIANSRFFTFDLDLGVMVTQNVAEYPPHHVTYEPGKFEVAKSNR